MKPLQIKIRVTGLLTEYFSAGKGELLFSLEKPLTVEEILQHIKLNHELVMTVVVSGQRRDLSYVPQDGEEIVLISPLAGG
ncbi:MAG: MoaD/ThiS family protein [Bacillota bacterium]|nr:MoaD/ThiS family protein [Bacillota bacterium]